MSQSVLNSKDRTSVLFLGPLLLAFSELILMRVPFLPAALKSTEDEACSQILQDSEMRGLISAGGCVGLTVAVPCSPRGGSCAPCPFCTVINSLEGVISGRLLFQRCLALPLQFCRDNTILSSVCCAGNAAPAALTSPFPPSSVAPLAARGSAVCHCRHIQAALGQSC